MRWLVVVALLGACASASSSAEDAGVDLTVGHCDPATLFPSCADQCHEPVCVVSAAMCSGSDWVCDCTMVQPCGPDMRLAD
jgi:hypothetical protein